MPPPGDPPPQAGFRSTAVVRAQKQEFPTNRCDFMGNLDAGKQPGEPPVGYLPEVDLVYISVFPWVLRRHLNVQTVFFLTELDFAPA